ncbi:hypothetical protein CBL_20437, partial [Carabus blaptoides fortunei]
MFGEYASNERRIVHLGSPRELYDAVNKTYVDKRIHDLEKFISTDTIVKKLIATTNIRVFDAQKLIIIGVADPIIKTNAAANEKYVDEKFDAIQNKLNLIVEAIPDMISTKFHAVMNDSEIMKHTLHTIRNEYVLKNSTSTVTGVGGDEQKSS